MNSSGDSNHRSNDSDDNTFSNNNHFFNEANNHVIAFMRQRRSVPVKFMSGPGPNQEQLQVILEIASRVPDHGKLRPWRFICYRGRKRVELGEKILVRAVEKATEENRSLETRDIDIEQHRFLHAPVVIAVVSCVCPHPKIPEWEQILSSGAAAMNLLIAANAYGFDAQWLTEWYAFDSALKGVFGLEEEERIVGFIHIGTRQEPKTERERPSFDEVCTFMDD